MFLISSWVMSMLLVQDHTLSSEAQTSGHSPLCCLKSAGFSVTVTQDLPAHLPIPPGVTPPHPPPEAGLQKEDDRMRLCLSPLVLAGLL